jgi:hypothetical protein
MEFLLKPRRVVATHAGVRRNGVQSGVNETTMTHDIEQAACPLCGELIDAEAVDCPHCDSYLGAAGRMEGEAEADSAMSWLIPIGRSGWAIAAGYLALFSILPLISLPFSPGAMITGVLAVRSIQQDSKLTGLGASLLWHHHGLPDPPSAAGHDCRRDHARPSVSGVGCVEKGGENREAFG